MRIIMRMKKRLYLLLSGPKLLHFVLPVLMAYIVAGTVAQKYLGLYEATKIFFASYIIWIGPVPLPGMPVLIAIIATNLLFKLLFKSPWHIRSAGIIITHIGAIALLLGGLLTAFFSHEGYIALGEGETKSVVSDYHAREFAILDRDGKAFALLDHKDIAPNETLNFDNAPFSLKIHETCQNCAITPRENATENHQSMAQHMQLSDAPLRINNEDNMAGMTFEIIHDEIKDIFVVLEDVPQLPRITIDDTEYTFVLRRQNRALPFSIELIDFEKESYKGTDMAKSYQSTVRIIDGDLQWDSTISMNAPLRYKGYTFFQSSFFNTPSGEVSVLAVVWNVGRVFPYISGIVMGLGLILHLFMRRRFAIMILLGALSFVAPKSYAAQSTTDYNAPSEELATQAFGQLPILDEGRIKPMDSFARAQLKTLAGKDGGALPWLIEVLFDPARAENRPVLKITNPDILGLLNLERRKGKLYSHIEVMSALEGQQPLILNILEAKEDDWSPQHRELIILQKKAVKLRTLLSSLSAFLPLAINAPHNAPDIFHQKPLTFYKTQSEHDALNIQLRSVVDAKGSDIMSYSDDEQILAQLSFTLSALSETGKTSTAFNVLPDVDKWHSPWHALKQHSDAALLNHWQSLAAAYHSGDAQGWSDTSTELLKLSQDFEDVRSDAIIAEYHYNAFNPFVIGFVLCLTALIILFISAFSKLSTSISIPFLYASITSQTIGIALRMFILERPPVSTLYETVLFVCVLSMIYAVFAYRKNKETFWLWIGAGLGLMLHLLGFSHDNDGDSFVMLSAVLNTNFWLTTHVLCITTAYAFCALTSLIAHYMLVKMAWCKTQKIDPALFKNLHFAALLSLLFAAVGTVLGGIWADQSWGRFWGWDPKENGALLIVLWLIWVLHGRISGQMKQLGVLYGMSYLSVILALSWFGVNILSVGLHSYGFTDSMAYSLALFIALETAFIAVTAILLKTQFKAVKHA